MAVWPRSVPRRRGANAFRLERCMGLETSEITARLHRPVTHHALVEGQCSSNKPTSRCRGASPLPLRRNLKSSLAGSLVQTAARGGAVSILTRRQRRTKRTTEHSVATRQLHIEEPTGPQAPQTCMDQEGVVCLGGEQCCVGCSLQRWSSACRT